MKKADLGTLVGEEFGGTKKKGNEVVDFVFGTMLNCLARGEDVEIAGFGDFKVIQHDARTARNPQTGATVEVPAKKVVKFKVKKALKDAVK